MRLHSYFCKQFAGRKLHKTSCVTVSDDGGKSYSSYCLLEHPLHSTLWSGNEIAMRVQGINNTNNVPHKGLPVNLASRPTEFVCNISRIRSCAKVLTNPYVLFIVPFLTLISGRLWYNSEYF